MSHSHVSKKSLRMKYSDIPNHKPHKAEGNVILFLCYIRRFREKQLQPALFVSHSGAQKPFVERLCLDLEAARYSVFFDKDSESVAKSEQSVAQALRAAQESRLGIFLLTEEFFTKSRWPMTQLVTFVASQATNGKQVPTAQGQVPGPRLLPLYYTLSRPELKSQVRQTSWFHQWEEWAKEDPRIDVKIWKAALRSIDAWKGIDLRLLKETSDDAFRREIVKRVADFNIATTVLPFAVAATPLASDETIIGRTRLCEVIFTFNQYVLIFPTLSPYFQQQKHPGGLRSSELLTKFSCVVNRG